MNILQRLMNSVTAAVTEEVFKSWKPARQKQYLKDHPNSKFGKKNSSMVTKKSVAPVSSKDEIKKLKEEKDSLSMRINRIKEQLSRKRNTTPSYEMKETLKDLKEKISKINEKMKSLKK